MSDAQMVPSSQGVREEPSESQGSNRVDWNADIQRLQVASFMTELFCAQWYAMGECKICCAVEAGRWHLSISCADRDPSWDEIATARYHLIPDSVTMAMLLPPKREYVNLHDHVFHLHELKDIDK